MNRYNHYNPELDAFELYHIEAEEVQTPSKQPSTRIQPPDEYNAVIAGLSGAIGTSISSILVYPIDLIVKRLQVQRAIREARSDGTQISSKDQDELYTDFVDAAKKIYKEEGGVSAFYSGCLQDTANSMSSAFIYFLSYHFMRQRRLQSQVSPSGRVPKTLGVFEELSVGVLSGAIAKFFTAPIANVVTRKQTAGMKAAREKEGSEIKKSSDVKTIVEEIYTDKGILGFWSGYDATLILTLNPAITFFLYESFKAMLPRRFREKPTGGQTFILAAVAKAMASSIMYPVSMAKTRSQVQSKKKGKGGLAIFESLKDIYASGGLAAMYEGVSGEILKGFFSNGITMLIKEALHRQILGIYFLLVRLRQRDRSIKEIAANAVADKLGPAKDSIKEGVSTTVKNTQNALTATQSQAEAAWQSGTEKATKATTDAQKTIAKMVDPETPHVGDISGEVGGIEWEDANLPSGKKEQ